MNLNIIQRDRAIGAVLGGAMGDALGAPYEFEPPRKHDEPIELTGGGFFNWEPGEWTDDTAMAICILSLLAEGKSLSETETQDDLVGAWRDWAALASDVGVQTRTILSRLDSPTREEALHQSQRLHQDSGRTAGNGSLMRTGPVFIGSLDSAETTAKNARAISKLTHWDDDAGDACVLWSLALQHAVLNGELDIRIGLPHLPEESQGRWTQLIDEAEKNEPAYFSNNGWVVHAFQAAWSAINLAVKAPEEQFRYQAERFAFGLEQAVRAGNDTDTVAAIAGSLLGAFYGSTSVPADWRLELHGWPGFDDTELVRLTNRALNGVAQANSWPNIPKFDYSTWSGRFELAQHPADEGLWLGGVGSLQNLPKEVTAVISLCRIGTDEIPVRVQRRLEIYLMDKPGPENNLNLGFTFETVAAAIKKLRDQGEIVYLHCVQSQSRTPSVAATYSVKYLGRTPEEAMKEISTVLPAAHPIAEFVNQISSL